jgi:hypothetical protein
MTEHEWQTASQPQAMLDFLQKSGKASDSTTRLPRPPKTICWIAHFLLAFLVSADSLHAAVVPRLLALEKVVRTQLFKTALLLSLLFFPSVAWSQDDPLTVLKHKIQDLEKKKQLIREKKEDVLKDKTREDVYEELHDVDQDIQFYLSRWDYYQRNDIQQTKKEAEKLLERIERANDHTLLDELQNAGFMIVTVYNLYPDQKVRSDDPWGNDLQSKKQTVLDKL